MAFREKAAWIALVSTLLVYGGYFVAFGKAAAAGRSGAMVGAISLAVIVYTVIQIILMAIAAATAPKEASAPVDERERTIQVDARAGAFHVLQLAGVVAVASVYFADKWVVANAMFGTLILADLARNLLVIVGYRRGV